MVSCVARAVGITVAIDAGNVALPSSGNYTVLAHLDAAGTPRLAVFQNDTAKIDAGKGRLTVRHAAAAPAVDVRANGAVPVGMWALRRVLADAMVHEAVLFNGALYSGAGLLGMRGRQIAVAPTADGGLLAQTLDLPPQRLPLALVADTAGAS